MAAFRSIERMSAEHEARGLLNLINLIEHCTTASGAAAESVRWAQEAEGARGRLERLYAAGLPREFMDYTPERVGPATVASPCAAPRLNALRD
jgi:hypothetical protein